MLTGDSGMTPGEAWRVLHSALNVCGDEAPVDRILAAEPSLREAWSVLSAHAQRPERDRRLADACIAYHGEALADEATRYLEAMTHIETLDLGGNDADP
jgi:hypothetical protein